MKVTSTQTTICRELVAKTKLELFNRYRRLKLKTLCGKFLNLAHYFPYDVKLRLLADSQSFLSNQKATNAMVGAENLLIIIIPLS